MEQLNTSKMQTPHGRRFKNVKNQNRTSNPKLGHIEI